MTSSSSDFGVPLQTALRTTSRSLREQMRITGSDVAHRKALLNFKEDDVTSLRSVSPYISMNVDIIVDEFYRIQTSIGEIDLLIGDADTLGRLKSAMRRYVLQLFGGIYDLEYVNTRLRIGLVHKRIGVEPKLYLSAIWSLQSILRQWIHRYTEEHTERAAILTALDKLFFFDTQFVFDTYIRSLTSAVESAKEKIEAYADSLEKTVAQRTKQLEELSQRDGLTGLLNQRTFYERLHQELLASQRVGRPVSLLYFDCDGFKGLNDSQGHLAGDRVLKLVSKALRRVVGEDGSCARYGGDEFCAILPGYRLDRAEALARRLFGELSAAECPLCVSVGIAQTGPQHYAPLEVLIREADRSMYVAKKTSGNWVEAREVGDDHSIVPPVYAQPSLPKIDLRGGNDVELQESHPGRTPSSSGVR